MDNTHLATPLIYTERNHNTAYQGMKIRRAEITIITIMSQILIVTHQDWVNLANYKVIW